MIIVLNEWKEIKNVKDGILSIFDMGECTALDVRDLKDAMFMITEEYFSIDILMQAIEDLLVVGDIKATVINRDTILITY